MKKFFRTFFSFNLILLMVAPGVTACTDQGIKLSEVATNLNLGYLENLKAETILAAFLEKNPKVDTKLVSCGRYSDNSYQKRIYTIGSPWNHAYKNSNVFVSFTSKLAFGNKENNTVPILFTNKKQQFTIPIAILTDDYDPSKDDDFIFSSNVWSDNTWDFNHELVLDETNKQYNLLISFNEQIEGKNEWSKDFTYSIDLSWGSIYLVQVQVNINF